MQQGLLIILFETAFPSESKHKGKLQPDNSSHFNKDLQEILEIREEVFQIFKIEPEGREESYIAKAMSNDPPELLKLRNLLQKSSN